MEGIMKTYISRETTAVYIDIGSLFLSCVNQVAKDGKSRCGMNIPQSKFVVQGTRSLSLNTSVSRSLRADRPRGVETWGHVIYIWTSTVHV